MVGAGVCTLMLGVVLLGSRGERREQFDSSTTGAEL
jgi:hypothetical protein